MSAVSPKYSELFQRIADHRDITNAVSKLTAKDLNLPVQITDRKVLYSDNSCCSLWPGIFSHGSACTVCCKVETTWLMISFHFGNFDAAENLIAKGATLVRADDLHKYLLHLAICRAFDGAILIDNAQYWFDRFQTFSLRHTVDVSALFCMHPHSTLCYNTNVVERTRRQLRSLPNAANVQMPSRAEKLFAHFVALYNSNFPVLPMFWPSGLLEIVEWLAKFCIDPSTMRCRLGVLEWANRTRRFQSYATATTIALLPLELPALVLTHILSFLLSDLARDEVAFLQKYYHCNVVSIWHRVVEKKPTFESLLPWTMLYDATVKAKNARRVLFALKV